MRFLGLLMLWPGFVLAQGWIEYANVEEGFFVNFNILELLLHSENRFHQERRFPACAGSNRVNLDIEGFCHLRRFGGGKGSGVAASIG